MRTSLALILAVLPALLPAQDKKPKPPAKPEPAPLGEAASATLGNAFASAESWSMQAMALLSLGPDWHPAASPAIAAALGHKDLRLAIYGIEQLRRTNDRTLPSVCTKEVVEALATRHAVAKNPLIQQRAIEVLARFLPEVKDSDPASIPRWWQKRAESYEPAPWTAAEAKAGAGTVSVSLVDKAIDLRDAGLQVAFVVDSTGSMQLAIDTVRDAINEISAILSGIAPKLELGLVHYKDFGDMGEPAEILQPLHKDPRKVRDRLAKLRAAGGGDIPERVEKGIECALSKKMGWEKAMNRMLIVVGDAPPHPETQTQILEMVRLAYEKPFQDPKKPVTGKLDKLRPFVTSTIATNTQANTWFSEIAEAGGGANVLMELSGNRRAERAPEQVAKYVLRQTFGQQFEDQIDAFVDAFFEYRRAKAF